MILTKTKSVQIRLFSWQQLIPESNRDGKFGECEVQPAVEQSAGEGAGRVQGDLHRQDQLCPRGVQVQGDLHREDQLCPRGVQDRLLEPLPGRVEGPLHQ